jgi:dUTP pyrophosphatase
MKEKLYFAKLRPGAVIPSKREEDAGYDIYACLEEDYLLIGPLETRRIPTGLVSAFSPDYYLQLQERGSTGTKGMSQRCGVIDSGFRDEWFIPMTNLNTRPLALVKPGCEALLEGQDVILYPASKAICQAVLLPVPKTEIVELSPEEIHAMPSVRGRGQLGSSGK